MRKLNAEDVIDACQLAEYFDFRKIYSDMKISGTLDKKDQEMVGYTLIAKLLAAATTGEAKERLFQWLSGPMEMDASDIRSMSAPEFIKAIKGLATMEEWSQVFTSALDSAKGQNI